MAYAMDGAGTRSDELLTIRLLPAIRKARWPLLLGQVLVASILWLAIANGASAVSFEIEKFTVPDEGQPFAITPGPDGNLWFAEGTSNSGFFGGRNTAVGRITPTGEMTVFGEAEPSPSSQAVVSGPDGNLWFTEKAAIGKITPSGAVSSFSMPNGLEPSGITNGPDGNLWFAVAESSQIGRITTTGQVTIFTGPGNGCIPRELAPGPGGVWFTEGVCEGGPHIGRVGPAGEVAQYSVDYGARGIAQGPDGLMWFTGEGGGIRRIALDGSVDNLVASRKGLTSGGQIVAGPDGNMWFITTFGSHPSSFQLERVTPQGRVLAVSPSTNEAILSLAAGPDGHIWFTKGPTAYPAVSGGHTIGRVTTPPSPGVIEILDNSAVAHHRQVALHLACQGEADSNIPCVGRLLLTVRIRRRGHGGHHAQAQVSLIARGTYRLPVGDTEAILMRLTRLGLQILAKHSNLRVDASAVAFGRRIASRRFVLKRPGHP